MKNIKKIILFSAGIVIFQIILFTTACKNEENKSDESVQQPSVMSMTDMEKRGEYLANLGHCNDCHSPKIMTPQGPVVDSSRLLSGSPSAMKLPPVNANEIQPGKWYLGSSDMTAWVGPWGISYSSNLTPDSTTGSGTWTEELFIKMLRKGKFMGVEAGRPIMPPMPWQAIGSMTDNDLKSLFAYLQSIPAINNVVNAYVPPDEMKSFLK